MSTGRTMKLLPSKLEAEYDGLRQNGYSGEGFAGEGWKVGEGCFPLYEAGSKPWKPLIVKEDSPAL